MLNVYLIHDTPLELFLLDTKLFIYFNVSPYADRFSRLDNKNADENAKSGDNYYVNNLYSAISFTPKKAQISTK